MVAPRSRKSAGESKTPKRGGEKRRKGRGGSSGLQPSRGDGPLGRGAMAQSSARAGKGGRGALNIQQGGMRPSPQLPPLAKGSLPLLSTHILVASPDSPPTLATSPAKCPPLLRSARSSPSRQAGFAPRLPRELGKLPI